MEKIDLRGEDSVDAELMAYLGAFRYLRSLNVADCRKVTSSALWPITGIVNKKIIIYLQGRVFLGHICICKVSYQSPSPNLAKMGVLCTGCDLVWQNRRHCTGYMLVWNEIMCKFYGFICLI